MSYQASTFTIRPSTTIVEGPSTIDDRGSFTKSADTSGRSSKPRMPAIGPAAASRRRPFTSATVTSRDIVNTQSVSDALSNGTRTAMPSSLPASSG